MLTLEARLTREVGDGFLTLSGILSRCWHWSGKAEASALPHEGSSVTAPEFQGVPGRGGARAMYLLEREQAFVSAIPGQPRLPSAQGSLQEGKMEVLLHLLPKINVAGQR
jgi:hypothetical protein